MKEFYMGIMSGTSCDGIDVAICEINDHSVNIIDYREYSYDFSLYSALLKPQTTPQELAELDNKIANNFARAALDSTKRTWVDAIGLHGHTFVHTQDNSIQLGNPSKVAQATGIPTVADFRRMDMARGGQGAPLVPAFHRFAFSSQKESVAIINVGGISNISHLANGQISGYDIGPGNCLMDAWARRCLNQPFDKDGALAASGNSHQKLLDKLLQHPYLAQPVPKSADISLFSLNWLNKILEKFELSDADVAATLLEYSAIIIADAVTEKSTYIHGGGAYNLALMQRLAKLLPEIKTTQSLGIAPMAVEACAFAWFAQQRLANIPIDTTSITGASGASLLGAIYTP